MLSVCIHARNRVNLLIKALESLSYQTSNDFEIIITDDMSTDQTSDMIEKMQVCFDIENIKTTYIKMDHTILYPNATNPSLLGHNMAVKHANNDMIYFTTTDIIHRETNIANAINIYDPNKIIYGNAYFTYPDKEKEPIVRFSDFQRPYPYIALFSREKFMSIGGFDERLVYGIACGDNELADRLAYSGVEWAWTNDLEGFHQWHKRADEIFGDKYEMLHNHNTKLWYENTEKARNGDFIVNRGIEIADDKCIVEIKKFNY